MNNPKIEEILKALRFEADIYVGSSTSLVCEAAADLITELQQELIDERYRHDRYADFCVAQGEELSKLKEQQRWIPVTEKLPEVDGKYIVCTAKNSVYCARWHKSYFGTDSYTHITHWMPLPGAPEEDK